MTTEQILTEYAKCIQDDAYAINNMLKVYDITQNGFVQFKLFPKQVEIVKAFGVHRHNIIAKPRQAGISTTTQAFLAVKAAFASKNKPEVILVIANKLTLAKKFTKGIKDFINQMPRWVFGAEFYGTKEREKKEIFATNSQTEMELAHNGSKIIAVATSGDALRGYSPTYLVFDEAAFIDNGEVVFTAAMASLSTGGKAILISTPNGQDPVYYETYKGSIQQENTNGFNAIDMRWYQDPRYNKDLQWLNKDGVVVHDEEDFDFDSYERSIRAGLKPTSTWYRDSCKALGNNKRKIAQELDVSFLGSGGNVIDDEYIIAQERENVMEPKWTDDTWYDGDTNQVWIWEEPIEGHKYILAADVASGAGTDFSTFSIINFTTMEQVAEFQGKVPPDEFANIINKYGLSYGAYVVVDNIGYGSATVLKLREMGYPDLHYDDVNPRALMSSRKENEVIDTESKIPGFNVSGSRLQLISNLEERVRKNEIKIRSKRIIIEMRTFIYKTNGRPDHADGKNDDCLMSLGIGLWIMESSFKRIKKNQNLTKGILDGWTSSDSAMNGINFVDKEQEERVKSYFNPFDLDVSNGKNLNNRQRSTFNNQQNYGWLFGR